MSNSILKNLVSSDVDRRSVNKQSALYVKKWQPTGLLEDLDSEMDVKNMALILENQAKQVIEESTRTGGENGEAWAGVALPLVRRVFGEIAAKEFVSVQPMSYPAGLVFYLDFKFAQGTTQPGFKAGSSLFGGSNNTIDGTNPQYFGKTDVAKNGFYGAGRFGFTRNDSSASFTSGSISTGSGFKITAVTSEHTADYNPELSASIVAGQIWKVELALPTNADLEGVRAFAISGSANMVDYYAQNTSYFVEGGLSKVQFIVSASAAFPTAMLWYHVQTTKDTRGDFEDQSYLFNYKQLDIPEIDLQLRSEPIAVTTRKLKAVWTPEMSQDLNAFHSVDADAELTSMLSEWISMEIDLEILDMLIQNALTEDYWTLRVGHEFDALQGRFIKMTDGSFYNKTEWFKTLGVKVQKVSNRILQKTMKGGANFMVVSPDVATILESIPGYAVDTDGDQMQFAMGVSKVGSFANRFSVYKNPYMTENVILLGFRGKNFFETGAVYAPYIPLITTPIIYDPNNLTPRKGVLTRYGKKIVRPEFYGRIVIEGLQTL